MHRGIRVSAETLATVSGGKIEVARPDIQLSAELLEGFVKLYLKEKFDGDFPTPWFHREMWRLCASREKFVAFAAPRGHAKSTAITHAYTLTSSLFRQRDFILILSDTWSQAVEFLGDLKTEIIENEGIIKDFEVRKFVRDAQDDVIVQMRDGYKFRIVARGAEQKVRGLKWNNKRPNLILFDDVEGDEQVESKTRRDKFFKWVMKAVLPCGSDDCLFRWVGTVMHFDSALQRILTDSKKSWTTRVYKAHESFSDFSNPLWPEKFPVERLKSIQQMYVAQGESDGYSQEYLNNPIAEGDSYFRPEDLLAMTDQDRRSHKVYYASTDCAVSTAQKADYTVSGACGIDDVGFHHIVDVRRARIDSKEIVDQMFSMQDAYSPAIHFIEKGTIQHAIGPFLYTEMSRRKRYINLDTNMVPTKDIVVRARVFQAMTKAKRVKFDKEASWWPEVEEELRRFPKGGHDDIIAMFALLGLGLEDVHHAPSQDELDEEEYRGMGNQFVGQNSTTGY